MTRLVSITAAARMLAVSPRQIRQWRTSGVAPRAAWQGPVVDVDVLARWHDARQLPGARRAVDTVVQRDPAPEPRADADPQADVTDLEEVKRKRLLALTALTELEIRRRRGVLISRPLAVSMAQALAGVVLDALGRWRADLASELQRLGAGPPASVRRALDDASAALRQAIVDGCREEMDRLDAGIDSTDPRAR